MKLRFNFIDRAERISPPIICFSLYLALMLYQPEGFGTYAAFGTIILTLIACFWTKETLFRAFKMPTDCLAIFLFLVIISLVTLARGDIPSSFAKFAGQVILYIVLRHLTIDEHEFEYLKWVFLIANVVYATVSIRYCISSAAVRYYHDNIIIFGASFDPNYIGISFVTSLVFLMDNVLTGKKRLISTIMYAIIAIAVVLTASRGNMVAWATSSALVIYFFFKNKGVRRSSKWVSIIVIFALMVFFVNYISSNFTVQWTRMVSIENDNGRFALWEKSVELWKTSPIWGGGLRSMYSQYGRASHNTYLQILVDGGIIGALLMILFFGGLLKRTLFNNKILFSALFAMLLQIFFLDALDNRCVWVVFCIIAMLPNGGDEKI